MSNSVIFMGTPDFAVESLKQIIESGIHVAAVVTSPDRPAGRGRKLQQSAVKQYALTQELDILQPEKLKSEDFINQLKSYNADLFVVVAFRMLPEIVWDMPPKGTINLHGSLLPQYRGAAPINWAVINGETQTGATTFFIEKEIDTGNIIDSVTIDISDKDTAGTVHDDMMVKGATLLQKTVTDILNGNVQAKPQSEFITGELKHAPKIFKPDCKINWANDTRTIYNKIRGLSPYPTAWTELELEGGKKRTLKLFITEMEITGKNHSGEITLQDKTLKFGTADGWIILKEIQLEGKKRMNTEAFILGFDVNSCKLVIN